MTPEEIEVLLNLSEAARVKLAAIPGPGWYAPTIGSEMVPLGACPSWPPMRTGVWCPADTFAIVQACGAEPSLAPYRRPAFCAAVKGSAGYGATPRLAALVLLETVCEREP